MKLTAAALLLAASTNAKQQPLGTTTADAAKVMEGLLMGAIDAEFQSLEHCILDGEAIIKDVIAATNDFKTKDVKKIVEGLKYVGDAIKQTQSAVKDCKGVEGDFEKLTKMAAYFSNPESIVIHIGKDLVIHGHDIYKEIKGAISAYDKHDYYNFGFEIGKAAA